MDHHSLRATTYTQQCLPTAVHHKQAVYCDLHRSVHNMLSPFTSQHPQLHPARTFAFQNAFGPHISVNRSQWSNPGRSGRRHCPEFVRSPASVSASGAVSTPTEQPMQDAPPTPVHTDALIIGGGPAGLAAAVMLAGRGWNVTVAERHAQMSYSDPDRSYVYAIDGRGRQFTDKYGITSKLADVGVDTKAVTVTRIFADGKAKSSRQMNKDEARIVYWLPRNSFMRLLEFKAKEQPAESFITLSTNTEALQIVREDSSSGGKQIKVTLRNTVTGNTMTFVPKLLLGCDGINSLVRTSLQDWAAEDSGSSSNGSSKFSMAEFPSLSTNLRFKVLQLPPNPAMKDGTVLHNPNFCLLTGQKTSIGGAPLRLGLLPIKDTTAGRTANMITMPDHPVWGVNDAEALYKVFEESLPQADWRELVPQPVMAKFAASKGGQFPAPQYSQGLAMVLSDATAAPSAPDSAAIKGSGAVLLGDAAHCFPPDLGQGVNSALEDVCVLEQQLEVAGDDLTKALPAFEQQRMPDSAALAKLVQIGFPLQYNQYPLLRALWNVHFILQVVAHKVLPFLISPPLFLMIQDPAQRYSSILQATERSRKLVLALGALLAVGLAWLLQRLAPAGVAVVKGLATGSA